MPARPGAATRYAVLLRGINIGGNRLPMQRFAAILTGQGHTEVRTLLASGQAVLTSELPAEEIAARLRPALDAEAGLRTEVFVRSGAQLQAIVAGCPYPQAVAEGTRHAVVFLDRPPTPGELAPLEAAAVAGPEEYAVAGSQIYLHLPDGFGRSPLAVALGRIRGPAGTTRNYNTVIKLRDLTAPA